MSSKEPTQAAGTPAKVPTPAPKPRTPTWRHILNGTLLVAFLVVAGVVLHTTPTEEQWQAPIPVTGAVGETLKGRNIQATVTDIRVADQVTASNGWSGETSGVWVVVDARVQAVLTDYGVSLGTAQLRIGDIVYSASERPSDGSIQDAVLSVGIAKTGPLLFEITRDALAGDGARGAQLEFAWNGDPRTDSMIVVPFDLTSVPTSAAITTDEPVWGNG